VSSMCVCMKYVSCREKRPCIRSLSGEESAESVRLPESIYYNRGEVDWFGIRLA